jgi:dTMP kinase
MKNQTGKLIVIEGCDGAGKETQTNMLMENLQSKNLKVVTVSFPRYDDTVAGRILKYILKNPEARHFEFASLSPEVASLYYAADRRESKEYVEKMLEKNDVVILDRYFTANILHQGAKFESIEDRNEYINTFTNIELEELKIPKPDSVIYLSLPYEISIQRMEKRYEINGGQKDAVEEDLEYVKRSNEKGKAIAEYCNWSIVDGAEEKGDEIYQFTREEVQGKILKILDY